MLVSAGPLHEAGAAENKDVIHGRQIICSVIHGAARHWGAERDGSFVPTLHRGTFDCWFVQYWSVPQEMFYLD